MAFNEVLRLVLDIDAASGKRELDDFTKKTSTNLNRVGSTMTKVGGTLTRQVTLPLVALGGVATKMATDFDTSFVRMQTLAGVTAGEVDGLKESVLGLSGETGRSPQELAEALFFLSSAGLDTAQSMEALEMSAKASAIGMGSTIEIADAVSSVMNAYATSNVTAAQALDVLVATARAGKAEPAELASQMGRVLPIAAQLGITFEDVGASIAALSTPGNDAAMATTQLTNVFAKLLKPSKQASEQLDAVGLSIEDVQTILREQGLLATLEELKARLGDSGFVKFFEDTQAIQGVLALTGENAEQVREIFDKLHDSTGSLDNAFGTWADSMGARNARAFAELQVAMIQFGDAIAPIASNVLGFVGDLLAVFSDLPEPMQNVVVGVLAFGAAMGPLLSVGGNVVTFMGNMIKLTGSLHASLGALGTAGMFMLPLLVASYGLFRAMQDNAKQAAEAKARVDGLTDAMRRQAEGARNAVAEQLAMQLATDDLGEALRDADADLSVFTNAIQLGGEELDKLPASFDSLDDAKQVIDDLAEDGSALGLELQRLAESGELSGEEMFRLLTGLQELSTNFDDATQATLNAEFAQDEMANSASSATSKIEAQTASLQELAEQLAATFDPIFAMADALRESQTAAANLRLAQQDLSKAVDQYGADSSEAFEAQQALTDAQVEARDSVINLQTAALGLQDAITTGGVSVEAAREQFMSMATQMGFTGVEANALAEEFGLAASEADRLAGQYTVGIKTSGVPGAVFDIDRVRAGLRALPTSHTITVAVQTKGGIGIPGAKIFHEGGVVPGRRGEEVAAVLLGQEEVLAYDDPRHSANLAHNVASAYMGAPTASAAVARVVIDITGGDDQLLRWLRNRVRVEGRGDVQVALGQRR